MAYLIVLTTVASSVKAKKLAKIVLENRLAACINIIPSVDSFYWWKGRIANSRELLLIFKTRKSHFLKLSRLIEKNHSYSTPEIIALALAGGSRKYLSWMNLETRISNPKLIK